MPPKKAKKGSDKGDKGDNEDPIEKGAKKAKAKKAADPKKPKPKRRKKGEGANRDPTDSEAEQLENQEDQSQNQAHSPEPSQSPDARQTGDTSDESSVLEGDGDRKVELTREQEQILADWWRDNPCYYDKSNEHYHKTVSKATMKSQKEKEMGIPRNYWKGMGAV